ncbi:MAG: TrkA C-terminal domain-containing protein [Symbiopectobacterium sp.]
MVLFQRRAYVDLVQGSVIDVAISPQQATISTLLGHVRKADIVSVLSLRRGLAEAIEAIAHGDEGTSKVVGRMIEDIKLPPGTLIGAIMHGDNVIITNDNMKIDQGDHVIMFLTDKKFVPEVERLLSLKWNACFNPASSSSNNAKPCRFKQHFSFRLTDYHRW